MWARLIRILPEGVIEPEFALNEANAKWVQESDHAVKVMMLDGEEVRVKGTVAEVLTAFNGR